MLHVSFSLSAAQQRNHEIPSRGGGGTSSGGAGSGCIVARCHRLLSFGADINTMCRPSSGTAIRYPTLFGRPKANGTIQDISLGGGSTDCVGQQ